MAKKGLTIGKQAPDFALEATTGGIVRRADFQGSPLIIVFFRGTF
jgi:peroxiredoxin